MRTYPGYLCDLDGTVYLSERLIPGAAEAISELRRRGSRFVFMSNKALQPRAVYAEKLQQLGIPVRLDDVINSSFVLAQHLARTAPGARLFVLGERPLLRELAEAGLRIEEDPRYVDYVVASFDRRFEYTKLYIAHQAIKNGAHFIATNADRTCPVEGGDLPDAASVIGAIEGCTGKRLEWVAGKPSRMMVEVGLAQLGVEADDCLVVGDRIETDTLMALEAGADAALVLTGVTDRQRMAQFDYAPTYVLDSIADLVS
jgi:NagD protein